MEDQLLETEPQSMLCGLGHQVFLSNDSPEDLKDTVAFIF